MAGEKSAGSESEAQRDGRDPVHIKLDARIAEVLNSDPVFQSHLSTLLAQCPQLKPLVDLVVAYEGMTIVARRVLAASDIAPDTPHYRALLRASLVAEWQKLLSVEVAGPGYLRKFGKAFMDAGSTLVRQRQALHKEGHLISCRPPPPPLLRATPAPQR